MTTVNRRAFLTTVGAVSAVTIVPRRVLGGSGYVAPSDMVLLAQIAVAAQAQRQVNTGLVERPDLQFVAVVDPNQDTQDYVDWDRWGNRDKIRTFRGNPRMGRRPHRHSRRTRRRAAESWRRINRSTTRPARGIRSYEDYREMFEKEVGHSGHREHHARIISTASINISGPQKEQGGDLAQAGSERAARRSIACCRRRATARRRRTCSPTATARIRHTLAAWIGSGVIGPVREVHNWTNRPFWPQGMQAYHASGPPVPEGFTGHSGKVQNRIVPTIRRTPFAVYRGWYAYGTGCLGDMGHYSLWQPYRILGLGVPEFVEARPNNDAFVGADHVSDGGHVSQVSLPKAKHHPLASPGDREAVPRSTRSGTTAA